LGCNYAAALAFAWTGLSRERLFSVNKEVTVEHLAETSLIAQRTIVDHIRSVGGFLKVDYCKELLLLTSSV
jgi:hypothetical protein